MAKALQCPNCGTKTRLDGIAEVSFRCRQCGQVLKVPPGARGRTGAAPSSVSATPPVPRRRSRPVATAGEGVVSGTAVMATPPVVTAPPPSTAPPVPEGRDALPVVVRVAAWVIALPIALAAVGIPARKAGYLTSQRLLDVIVDQDLARFVPLGVIIVLWAVVTAVLVTVFVEGGRRLMLRRRRTRERRGALDTSPVPDEGTSRQRRAGSGRRGRP